MAMTMAAATATSTDERSMEKSQENAQGILLTRNTDGRVAGDAGGQEIAVVAAAATVADLGTKSAMLVMGSGVGELRGDTQLRNDRKIRQWQVERTVVRLTRVRPQSMYSSKYECVIPTYA